MKGVHYGHNNYFCQVCDEYFNRESLAGLPRASLSGLFRQSLSIQELDRMFDDDSTQSFEDLERRLKTLAKAKASSRITDKVQEESPKNDSKNSKCDQCDK